MTCRAQLLGLTALLMFVPPIFTAEDSLASIESELNLERRSRRALEFAHARVRQVVDAYLDAKPQDAREFLDQIGVAVNLSAESLTATGKHPRKNPKHFKHAEIQTRKLVVKLKAAQRELIFQEQREIDPLIRQIEDVNSKLLLGIMSRKK